MESIKVLVNGAFGRMGQVAVKAIQDHPHLELVGQIGREYDLQKSIRDSGAQVVIDFTIPTAVYENTLSIIEADAHPVIGTSGLKPDQIEALIERAKAKQLGGIIAPNFSLSAVLMMKAATEIVKYMPRAEIIEMHHDGKMDSPSGTALRTAQLLATSNPTVNMPAKKTHETVAGARGANHQQIPIHSIRLPGLLANEDIIFGNLGETLTLSHKSIDRLCFVPGICLACEKVGSLKTLIYGLENIL